MQVYIEGYLQAMLDTMFRQDYLKVKVTDEEVGPVSLCNLESQMKACLRYTVITLNWRVTAVESFLSFPIKIQIL